MKTRLFILIAITTLVISCKNESSEKEKELQLKEKELEIKEKELLLKETENSKENKIESKSTENSSIENLIGNWFIPHGAVVNISFDRNGRFEFNDYNSNTEEEEHLTGQYKLENGILSLLYDDRPKQKFKFTKGTDGDTNYYITKGNDYYFVKGDN